MGDEIAGACVQRPRRNMAKTGKRTLGLAAGALQNEGMEPADLVCEPPLRLEAH